MIENLMLFTDDICRAAWLQMHKTKMTPVLEDGKVIYMTVRTNLSEARYNMYRPTIRDAVGLFGMHLLQLVVQTSMLKRQQNTMAKGPKA